MCICIFPVWYLLQWSACACVRVFVCVTDRSNVHATARLQIVICFQTYTNLVYWFLQSQYVTLSVLVCLKLNRFHSRLCTNTYSHLLEARLRILAAGAVLPKHAVVAEKKCPVLVLLECLHNCVALFKSRSFAGIMIQHWHIYPEVFISVNMVETKLTRD